MTKTIKIILISLTALTVHYKTTLKILLKLTILFTISCDRETSINNKTDHTHQNQFPIDYIGDKILEFNKPIALPMGGPPIAKDTFALYCITNKSSDIVWIETVPNLDTTRGYFKDKSIKTIYMNNTFTHLIKDNQWGGFSDGNGCWGGCNDSLKLLPNEKLFFIKGHKGKPDYDSTKFDITVKIKKGNSIIDSIITKKLFLKNNHFCEDTTNWKTIEKH